MGFEEATLRFEDFGLFSLTFSVFVLLVLFGSPNEIVFLELFGISSLVAVVIVVSEGEGISLEVIVAIFRLFLLLVVLLSSLLPFSFIDMDNGVVYGGKYRRAVAKLENY